MRITRLRYEPTDPRLGRHIHHDSRSRDFAYEADDLSNLRSVRHHSHIPVLDQGQVGSCTGNAATKNISHTSWWNAGVKDILSRDAGADEAYAVGVYSDAEVLDGDGPYVPGDPSTDHGSSGLSVAKVLKNRGIITGYKHAFSLEATLTALSRRTVIIGIPWLADMFNPDSNGFLSCTGEVAGGHEICLDELNVEGQYVEFPNSWGASWGIRGRAKIRWADLEALLDNQGDCTIFDLPAKAA